MENGANISRLATCPMETEYDLVGEVVRVREQLLILSMW